jgi:hypothetical protein
MKTLGRSVLAIVAGAFVAIVLISIVETVSGLLFPLPSGVDVDHEDVMRQYIAQLPLGAFVLVLVGWAAGSFAGGWVAARLAGRAPLVHGLIVGVLFLTAGVLTMLSIPHPLFMWVGGIVLPLACSYLGSRIVGGPPRRSGMTSA